MGIKQTLVKINLYEQDKEKSGTLEDFDENRERVVFFCISTVRGGGVNNINKDMKIIYIQNTIKEKVLPVYSTETECCIFTILDSSQGKHI